jgi:tetratricopeptide (TPR) repeat protein
LLLLPASGREPASAAGQSSADRAAAKDDAFQRGLIALKEGRFDAALQELTAAESQHPSDAAVRNFRGIALARLGRNAEAVGEYQVAIRMDPRMGDAYRNLGFLEWTEQHLESARVDLEHAVELSPDDSFAHYYLGRVQLDSQLYAQAFHELGRSRVATPSDARFLIEAATGYAALGQQAEARKTLDHLAAMTLSDAQSAHVASLFLAAHENEKAIDLLRKLNNSKLPSPSFWAQFDLALAYLLAANYQKAADQARTCAEALRSPDSDPAKMASAWSLIGIANARLGQGERAIDAFQMTAKLTSGQEEPWLNLTRELMELGHYADAIASVQEGLALNPKSYALHLRLGAANLAAGRYSEAETAFRDLTVAGDPLSTSYVGLAQVLLRTGRADEAASELAAAEQRLGPQFLISYFRGLALNRAGKPVEAMSAFQQALRLDPSSAEAHLELGKTALALGRLSDATTELKETLRLSPGNVRARRLLSQVYGRAGDAKTASQYADEDTETPPAAEGDLLGDFFLPQWQVPPEDAGQ